MVERKRTDALSTDILAQFVRRRLLFDLESKNLEALAIAQLAGATFTA